ncbi:MAG: SDR family oxidoreductase [Planctomycetaceae bacterium]|nr:MAG: SDR family oxidoreductase [Planctomycetaceae bacterium]
MLDLTNRTVVITGGGTGIGAGIARELAMAGCRVIVGGRREEPLRELSQSVDSPTPIRYGILDVAEDQSIHDFFKGAVEQVGEIDILVNSAGVNIPNRTIDKMLPDDWDRVLRINATGAYRCMLEVLPAMRRRHDGVIINISSISGKRAIQLGGVVYCASKFAMTALGTTVANEVRNEGVRITNVYPGEVDTPLIDKRPVPVSQAHRDSMLKPEDIAAVVGTICRLPARANVPEVVVKPTVQEWF